MNNLNATLIVGEEVARGHFGRVHIGSDGIREKLAVKALYPLENETPEKWAARKAGLLKEGASLEKAKHQNIVPVYYLCGSANDDAVHLVMEFCEGGSLEKAYRAGPQRCDKVLKIAREVCHGLAALHDRGMLHRDLKPGNILLDDKGTAKIGDFGFVTDEIMEGYAAGAGYRDHLAPEFYTDRVSSIRTDLWALGMTLYRLLHGHVWYQQGTAPRYLVEDGGFADSLQWLPHIDKKWRRIIRSLLNDDPHARPEHARALNRALADVEPTDWDCTVGDDKITWSRSTARRNVVVELLKHSERSFSWQATSHPVGAGRSRSLGGSSKISYSKAEKELRAFFT